MEQTYTLQELPKIAETILAQIDHKTVLFYGDMGVGKTTLIKEMAKSLGCVDSMGSPTFSLVNEYSITDDILFHFDFYRIENEEEALDLGIEDYLYSGHWNLIEWPEKIDGLLPKETTKVQLTINQNGSRTLNLEPLN